MILGLIRSVGKETSDDYSLMCVAAASLAVATALRPSELLGSAKLRDRTLRRNQLQFFVDPAGSQRLQPPSSLTPHHCALILNISKTNQRGTPKPRYIGIPDVVRLLWTWYNKQLSLFPQQGSSSHPSPCDLELFMLPGRRPLRTRPLLSFVQDQLALIGYRFGSKLTGKTFRIGGASSLAALGAPAEDIRTLGGWAPSSETWRTYASPASHRARALLTQQNLQRQAPANSNPQSRM
jgi:hypothetical protein